MSISSSTSLMRQEPRVGITLTAATLIGWAFLAWAVVDMGHPLAQLMMPMDPAWSMGNFFAVFIMWAAMMMAMMLPAAAPMILTFVQLCRQKGEAQRALIFVAAYLLIWAAFSASATLLHWSLQTTGLITPMMASNSVWLTATLLVIAGVVQFSPLKQVCLRHCRTPMGFLLTEWRNGLAGAWRMGTRHGIFCLGCCWALMALLFVAGVMNLAWVAALTAAVMIEKLHPSGVTIGRILGGLLIVSGLVHVAMLGMDQG